MWLSQVNQTKCKIIHEDPFRNWLGAEGHWRLYWRDSWGIFSLKNHAAGSMDRLCSGISQKPHSSPKGNEHHLSQITNWETEDRKVRWFLKRYSDSQGRMRESDSQVVLHNLIVNLLCNSELLSRTGSWVSLSLYYTVAKAHREDLWNFMGFKLRG